MRAVSLATISYGRGTTLVISSTWPPAYDLTGKVAVLELQAAPSGGVLFQIDSTHGDLSITGQVITLSLDPTTASSLEAATSFATIAAANRKLDFSISVGPSGTTDYRLQGDLNITPEQGSF